jgi:hypothetical protein
MFSPQPVTTSSCPSASPPNALESELLAESAEQTTAKYETASSANYETALRRIFEKDVRAPLADKINLNTDSSSYKKADSLDFHIIREIQHEAPASPEPVTVETVVEIAESVVPEREQAETSSPLGPDDAPESTNPPLEEEEAVVQEPAGLSEQEQEEIQKRQQQQEQEQDQEEHQLVAIEAKVIQAADIAINEADSMLIKKKAELQKQLNKVHTD